MKKRICLLLAALLLTALCACGGSRQESEIKDWTRQGYYTNENGDMLLASLF